MTTERAPPTGVALAEAQPHRRRGRLFASAAAVCVLSAGEVTGNGKPTAGPAHANSTIHTC